MTRDQHSNIQEGGACHAHPFYVLIIQDLLWIPSDRHGILLHSHSNGHPFTQVTSQENQVIQLVSLSTEITIMIISENTV